MYLFTERLQFVASNSSRPCHMQNLMLNIQAFAPRIPDYEKGTGGLMGLDVVGKQSIIYLWYYVECTISNPSHCTAYAKESVCKRGKKRFVEELSPPYP